MQEALPSAYKQTVRQRLQAYLLSQFHALSLPKGSVVVSFVLSHDGQMVGEAQATSAEGDAFIAAAKQALQTAQPFAPFPAGTSETEVRFRLAVDYVP